MGYVTLDKMTSVWFAARVSTQEKWAVALVIAMAGALGYAVGRGLLPAPAAVFIFLLLMAATFGPQPMGTRPQPVVAHGFDAPTLHIQVSVEGVALA